MKRIFGIVIFLAAFLFSCSSTGFLGLAKEDYVLEMEKKQNGEVQQLKDDIGKMKELTDQLDSLVKDMSESKQAADDAREATKKMEERIAKLSKETIEKLIQVLQKYVDEK